MIDEESFNTDSDTFDPSDVCIDDEGNIHERHADVREEFTAKAKPRALPEIVIKGATINHGESARVLFAQLAKSGKYYRRIESDNKPHLWCYSNGLLSRMQDTELVVDAPEFVTTVSVVTDQNGNECFKRTAMTRESAHIILSARDQLMMVPPIERICAKPLLVSVSRTGGTKTLQKGYHSFGGGTIVTGGDFIPEVELSEAINSINGLLDDFDFVTPGDRARAISGFITPALKLGGFLAKDRAPLDMAQADSPGAGKGLRTSMVAAIYGETVASITQTKGGTGSIDESAQRQMINGRAFICFDNMTGSLKSMILESVIDPPSPKFDARGIGKSAIVDLSSFYWMMTSNGVQITDDMKRRISSVTIRKRPPGHKYRVWPEGRPDLHIEANQAYYLGCVHSIIRAWDKAKRPKTNAVHSFDDWARSVDWICVNLFKSASVTDGLTASVNIMGDPFRLWLRAISNYIVAHGERLDASTGLCGPFTAIALVELAEESGRDELEFPKLTGANDTREQAFGRKISAVLGRRPQSVGVEPFVDIGGVGMSRHVTCPGGTFRAEYLIGPL